MSALLHIGEGENLPNLTPDATTKLRQTLVFDVIKFLEKQRQLIELRPHLSNEHKWGMIPKNDKSLVYVKGADVYGERAIFPAFCFKELKEETEKAANVFRRNNEELNKIAFWYDFFCCFSSFDTHFFFYSHGTIGTEVKCLMCSKTFTTVPEVQIHLFTKLHTDRTMQYHAEFEMEKFLPESKQMFKDTSSIFSDSIF